MSLITSPNMALSIPTVGSEPGPLFAYDINASLTLIDQHDHSPGRGVQITPAGLNINDILDMNSNSIDELLEAIFVSQSSSSTLQALYVKPGTETPALQDLWYNDSAGNAVQLTSNGLVNATIASLPGQSYAGGTFFWKQGAGSTVPANFDIGHITLRPNTALTAFGVILNPPSAIASEYDIFMPLLPGSNSIMAIDSSGVITTPITVTDYNNSLPDNAGAQGNFLRQASSGRGHWSTPDATIQTKTANYTVLITDDVVLVSGSAFTLTLPTAVGNTGKVLTLKKTDSSFANIITIDANSTETIDGNLTVTMNTQNETYVIFSDGSNWQIKDHMTAMPVVVNQTVTLSTGAFGVNSFTSSFSTGANSIVVSSATGLVIGQYLTDISTGANLQANTYITSISGTTVGLSLPTAGNSAGGPGDTIHTVPAYWRLQRENNYLIGELIVIQTTAGTAGSGVYKITMPSSLSMDSAIQLYSTSVNASTAKARSSILSTVNIDVNTGTSEISGNMIAFDSTTLEIAGYFNNSSLVLWSNGNAVLNNAIISVNAQFKIAISGWYT